MLVSNVAAAVKHAPLDIAQLYAATAPFVARVIQRLTGDGPHVDDLLQETFIVAFKKRQGFDGKASARTWLYAIASNLSRRHARSTYRNNLFRGRVSRELDGRCVAGPDQDLDRQRDIALVHEVLQSLPFKQREVFVLYELEELGGDEISELLAVPTGTVWTRLHHGRKRFKDLMRQRLSEEQKQ